MGRLRCCATALLPRGWQPARLCQGCAGRHRAEARRGGEAAGHLGAGRASLHRVSRPAERRERPRPQHAGLAAHPSENEREVRMHQYGEIVDRSADTMKRLIRDLLETQQIERGQLSITRCPKRWCPSSAKRSIRSRQWRSRSLSGSRRTSTRPAVLRSAIANASFRCCTTSWAMRSSSCPMAVASSWRPRRAILKCDSRSGTTGLGYSLKTCLTSSTATGKPSRTSCGGVPGWDSTRRFRSSSEARRSACARTASWSRRSSTRRTGSP